MSTEKPETTIIVMKKTTYMKLPPMERLRMANKYFMALVDDDSVGFTPRPTGHR